MREAVKKNKALITPVEGADNTSANDGSMSTGRRGRNPNNIHSDTQEILVESTNQDVDRIPSPVLIQAGPSNELLQPSEAAFYLPMEEIEKVEESASDCRPPQWSSNDESDDTKQKQKKRWDKTRSSDQQDQDCIVKPKPVAEREMPVPFPAPVTPGRESEIDDDIERLVSPVPSESPAPPARKARSIDADGIFDTDDDLLDEGTNEALFVDCDTGDTELIDEASEDVHEPVMRMAAASPPGDREAPPRRAPGAPPPPPDYVDITKPETDVTTAEIDSFFGCDAPQPEVPAPPPVPAIVTQPAPPPAMSNDDSSPFLNFETQVQKRAEEVNTNPELGKGDEPKFPDSEPITDLTEIARQTERILGEVGKTLATMTEIMQDTQENEVENTVFLSSKYRNKFLFLRNVYFSLPKQPIKQREMLRIKIADLLWKDENFLLYTAATIDFAYNNGYDEDGQLRSCFTRSLVNPLTVLYNFTDAADEFTARVCKTPGLMSLLVKIAEEQYYKIADNSCDKYNRQVVLACVAVTYNCSTRERNRKVLRNLGAVKMLIPFLDCPKEKFQLDALFGLAFLCDEHESEIFQARMPLIQFFMNKMKKALKDECKKCDGLSLHEMTRACCRLAINDENKQLLGEAGAIDILVEIASQSDGDPEQIDATEALWTLSFEATNKERIRSNTKAMELLTYLADSEENKQMAKSARGCLWTIGKERLSPSEGHAEPRLENQIMISYQWKYQELILKVRDRLRDIGYKIWIDVEQMNGSTLEAMATAVEESTVVLVAMSQSYKDGCNTRAEAEYAFTKEKRIIPLRVESNYRPDGWLGIIVGSKLYYDISSEDVFEQKINELAKEIMAQGSEPTIRATVAATAESNPPMLVTPKLPRRVTLDEDETNQWLRNTQFNSPHLHNLTVEHFRCLRNMKIQAPVFYYDYVQRLITAEASLDQMSDMATISNKLDELG